MGMARRIRLLPGIVGIALVFALLAACGGAGAGGSTERDTHADNG